MLGVVILTNAN